MRVFNQIRKKKKKVHGNAIDYVQVRLGQVREKSASEEKVKTTGQSSNQSRVKIKKEDTVTMSASNGRGAEDNMAELSKTLKEGERIVAPTRRPDGTLRKPIRIRAGYVPQDEVAIYKSKGALVRLQATAIRL